MPIFKTVKPQKVSDQVFEQIRDLIFRGQLKPGEQLPPERELVRTLGISRPPIREAINRLVARGLVEHRQGQGTFVRAPSSAPDNPLKAVLDGQEASLMDLLEVRLGLECNAAVMAARRATEEDITPLKESVQRMVSLIKAGDYDFNEDTYFHIGIAYATKNTVQMHIMKNLYDLIRYGIKESLAHLYEDPANMETICTQHEAILDAICRHDPQAAFEAMHRHITFVIDFFTRRTAA